MKGVKSKYKITKFINLSVGIFIISMLLPLIFEVLNFKMPFGFSQVLKSENYLLVVEFVIKIQNILLIAIFVLNFILLFFNKTISMLFYKLSILLALWVIVLFHLYQFTPVVEPIVKFVFTKLEFVVYITFILAVISFIYAFILKHTVNKLSRVKNAKARPDSFVTFKSFYMLIIALSYLLLLFVNLNSAEIYSIINIFVSYMAMGIYFMIAGIWQFVIGSKRHQESIQKHHEKVF